MKFLSNLRLLCNKTEQINACKFKRVITPISSVLQHNSTTKMSTSTSSCHLMCLQRSHENILLPDGVTVNVGRSPATKIIDPRCSRNQVAVTSNWAERTLKVQQLGANPSTVDGDTIGLKKEVVVGENATIFILAGNYPHKVIFGEKNGQNHVENGKNKAKGKDNSLSNKEEKDDHDERKTASKRSSSTENGLPSAKRKKQDTSDSIEKKDASKQKSTEEKDLKDDPKNIKMDDEEEHLRQLNSKLAKMKDGIGAKPISKNKDNPSEKTKSPISPSPPSSCDPLLSKSRKQGDSLSSSQSSSKSIKPAKDNVWTQHEHLHVFTSKGIEGKNKIAGFDVDGTIILTKSGKTFPTDSNDWRIAYPDIYGRLKQLHRDGFKIVFFTNQMGVARGKIKIEDLKGKLANIVQKVQVPVQVFVATHDGKYRKPREGMWRKLKNEYNDGVSIDISQCVYIGDAAGRPADWEPKKKKDFSCSDRLFALNIGLDFQTPEEFFLGRKKAPFKMPVFDPRKVSSSTPLIPSGQDITKDEKELIVLVGFPASGKSHLSKHILKPKGYIIVSRDTLGSWQKCVKVTKESLVNSSVVIDNTNLTPEERQRYVECGKSAGVPCRCLVMTTTFEQCRHNEKFRELTDTSHAKINEIIFNQSKTKYKEPNLTEGFSEIVKVNFVPKFSSSSKAAEYKKFILDK